MKRWITGALAISLFLVTACDNRPENALVIGMELTYPPFEMKDSAGNPTGVSIDMAEALAEELGKELVIKDLPFQGLPPALTSGKIDLIISSMTITEERKKNRDFSDPYVTSGLSLLVRKDSPITGIADLKGKKVAVKLATTSFDYATKNFPKEDVKVLNHAATCVEELLLGRVDAFIYDQLSVYNHWKKNEDKLKALLEPFQTESWGIAMKKGDTEQREKVNAFLKKFREEGGFEKLADKYMKEQKEEFEKLGTSFIF